MTMVLAIDTTGTAPAMALLRGDEVRTAWQGDAAQTPLLDGLRAVLDGQGLSMPALREDSSAVAAAMGPGRYARLRAGVAIAKGLATGWGVPFIGVRSAAAVTDAAGGHAGPIVIPAGRSRVYCWTDEPGEPLSPAVDASALVDRLGSGTSVAGDVDDATAAALRAAGLRLKQVRPIEIAEAVGRLAGERDPSTVGVEVARPIYVPAADHG